VALYAFDGTNDDARDDGTDAAGVAKSTNVWKFYNAYDGMTSGSGVKNLYVPGVGTRFGDVGKVVGGAFGVGWLDRVNDAYDALCAAWAKGDHIIDVIGFSRGSATALDFVNKVAQRGIRKGDTVIEPNPRIRFLGLFDVVAAFGVANLGFVFAELNVGHHLTLPPNVDHCFHAISLDERRPSFVVTRVDGAYPVWFRGVHSDIGGGNENVGLSNITLRWMYHKAMLAGLPITSLHITDGACEPCDRIRPNFFSDLSKLTWRDLGSADILHYTVALHKVLPDEPCRTLVPGAPVETEDFERQRAVLQPTSST
jgi:uncharacterized protein (DUF2235 family)